MGKYIITLNDLVAKVMFSGADIKAKADKGDAESCFQMGMINLLGINSSIDFKKAKQFFGSQSLSGNLDAKRLLGFIAECEGQYSISFNYFAEANKENKSFITKVSEERDNLKQFFNKLNLSSIVLNKEINEILNEYIKGGDSTLDAKIKLAYVCEDESSYLDVVKTLLDAGRLFSAKAWLNKGQIDKNNSLYRSLESKLSDIKNGKGISPSLDVIEIKEESFLSDFEINSINRNVKSVCDDASVSLKKEWEHVLHQLVQTIIADVQKEEAARIQREKEAERIRKQKEEAARIQREKEEAERIRKQKEEAARIQREKEAERIRKQKEEAARIQKEKEEAARIQREKEAERIRKQKEEERIAYLKILPMKRKKIYRRYNLIFWILASPFVSALMYSTFKTGESSITYNILAFCIIFGGVVFIPYLLLKWILKKICKL